jgi:hypothetical protein
MGDYTDRVQASTRCSTNDEQSTSNSDATAAALWGSTSAIQTTARTSSIRLISVQFLRSLKSHVDRLAGVHGKVR